MNSIRKNLGWFLLGLCSPHVLADQTEIGHRTVLAPTMAVFYVIDSEGRSVLAAPSVPVILSSHANSSRSVVESRRSFKQKARRKRGQSRVILIRLTRKSHDAREAFRCEQHGFYYTNDGRCVRPVLRGKQFPKWNQERSFLLRDERRRMSAIGRKRPLTSLKFR
jgi:hypothetical protein